MTISRTPAGRRGSIPRSRTDSRPAIAANAPSGDVRAPRVESCDDATRPACPDDPLAYAGSALRLREMPS